MNPFIQKLIAIASAEVGVREAAVNNTGVRVVEYQMATWLAPAPWAWCAAFMAWCLREWLKDAEVQAHFNITPLKVNTWRCRDASAFGWEKWAKEHGFYLCDEKEQAKAGDLVVFDFSHIGMVVEDQLPGKDYIETIEGNTNGKGERDSLSGDGVWRKTRKTNLVRHYIRLIA